MKDEFDENATNPQGQGDPSSEASEEYQVGYGKPPKHTQFPHGNGPGKGRPKGTKNMKTIVKLVTSAKLPTKLNGKTKKINKIELAMHQLANKAAGGDLKAIDKLIALYERYGPEEHSVVPTEAETQADIESLKEFLAMQEIGKPLDEKEEGNDSA